MFTCDDAPKQRSFKVEKQNSTLMSHRQPTSATNILLTLLFRTLFFCRHSTTFEATATPTPIQKRNETKLNSSTAADGDEIEVVMIASFNDKSNLFGGFDNGN